MGTAVGQRMSTFFVASPNQVDRFPSSRLQTYDHLCIENQGNVNVHFSSQYSVKRGSCGLRKEKKTRAGGAEKGLSLYEWLFSRGDALST